ncbi:RING-H2 finger protein ATL22 [Forsythia ovata]|uniref:RING-type E3 ubiquitin transferase n=1 Tax=Forsythia ovata TaxID=205694 RepID=A0ABD1QT34_9LAMI
MQLGIIVQLPIVATTGFPIHFPFWLETQQPQNCKNPGFNLSCNNHGGAVLNLPYSSQFNVRNIYYYIGRIQLSDPNNCLPRRLLSLNLSLSPFRAVSYQNYTFLSCPRNLATSLTTAIDCLSNSTTSILATKYQSEVMRLYMCKKIVTLPIPVSSQYEYELPLNIELTWNVSIYNNRSPAAAYCMVRRESHQAEDTIPTSVEAAFSTNMASGIDESTIESYKKITLVESRRIPGPNGITCAICLGDYGPKETVKIMPECEHCFHVECIDKWLRMNSNCPICRNSPC